MEPCAGSNGCLLSHTGPVKNSCHQYRMPQVSESYTTSLWNKECNRLLSRVLATDIFLTYLKTMCMVCYCLFPVPFMFHTQMKHSIRGNASPMTRVVNMQEDWLWDVLFPPHRGNLSPPTQAVNKRPAVRCFVSNTKATQWQVVNKQRDWVWNVLFPPHRQCIPYDMGSKQAERPAVRWCFHHTVATHPQWHRW